MGTGPQGTGPTEAEGAGPGKGPPTETAAGARTHEAEIPGRRGEGGR